MPVNYPQVHPNDVKNFAKVWNLNGITMILDATTLQFATDFANTALRSYIDHLVEQGKKIQQQKAAQGAGQVAATPTNAVAIQPVPQASPQKGLITLTDAS